MQKIIKKRVLTAFLAILLALSTVPAAHAAQRELVPVGRTVGIRMTTDGVMVVGLSMAEDDAGLSPAGEAGILPGDVITHIDGADTRSAAEFLTAISRLSGAPVELTVQRRGQTQQLVVTPKQSGDGLWQLGLWLRDSVTGIGTLTYYDPETGTYGALGHPISDVDTGVIMPLREGCIMHSSVAEVKKGVCGRPGELCGCFDEQRKLGSILTNCPQGIYGQLETPPQGQALPVAESDEVRIGPASILANVQGELVESFQVEIVRLCRDGNDCRDLMLRITDPQLLAMTGGIVQGMSGSPIIQDGKLIGAVTHVLVNDPTRGYGIFIENMLDAAK